MANQIQENNYPLNLNNDSIQIGSFSVPFDQVDFFQVLKDRNAVRVWFTGAMGLTGSLLVDFELETAQNVNHLAQQFLNREVAQVHVSNRPDRPLYTISPQRLMKQDYEILANENESQLISTYVTYGIMAETHERLAPIYAPYFAQAERTFEEWNSVNLETLHNIYKRVIQNTPLEFNEMDTIIEAGAVAMEMQRIREQSN